MYHEYFGLARPPFRITPDTDLFYPGGGRGEVLEALVYAITSGEGIVKVTGEVGTGKTMLCRMLEVRLPKSVDVVYIANPGFSPEEILHAIALEMDLPVAADANRLQVLHALHQRLLQKHAGNRRVVVFVEEAQGMPLATLEEVRLLSNLETQRDKLLQIVLFGQPELEELLDRPEIRQLRERITHSFRLAPLSGKEVREYVTHRMRAVGYRGPDVFRDSAYRGLARASEGLVRRVNILADKALLAAFADDSHSVSRKQMRVAIEDGRFGPLRRRWRRRVAWLGGAGVAMLLTVTLVLQLQPWSTWLPAPATVGSSLPSATPVPAEQAVPAGNPPASAPVAETTPAASSTVEPAVAGDGSGAPSTMPSPASGVGATATSAVVGATPSAPAAVVGTMPSVLVDAVAPQQTVVAVAAVQAPVMQQPPQPDVAAAGRVQSTLAGEPGAASAPSASATSSVPMAAPVPVTTTPVAATATATSPPPEEVAGISAAASRDVVAEPAAGAAAPVPREDAAPAPAGVATGVDDGSLLEQRLAATRRWLETGGRGSLSIQLLLADVSKRDAMEQFLQRMQRLGTLGEVYVYRTDIGSRSWYGVLLGEFGSHGDAQKVLDALPADLRQHKPFIRNVRDVGTP